MQLTQDGKIIHSAQSQATFHLEDSKPGLRMYLPKDQEDREVCFERQLPKRLCEFLKVTDKAAEGVIGSIFRKDNPRVLNRILDDAGVGQVNCDFEALNAKFAENEPEIEELVESTRNVRLSSPSPLRTHESGRQSSGHGYYSPRSTAAAGTQRSTPTPRPQSTTQACSAYEEVLKNVVNIARKRVKSGIFQTATAGLSMTSDSLANVVIKEAFAYGSQDRDFMLGAAGELYVSIGRCLWRPIPDLQLDRCSNT